MNSNIPYFRNCLLYEFQLGHNATQAHKNLCKVFREETPSKRTCRNWFSKFRLGDFSIENEPHPDLGPKIDLNKLLAINRSEPQLSLRKIASELGCHHSTIFIIIS